MGAEFESYAHETRNHWMPPAVLLLKPSFAPEPDVRDPLVDMEMLEIRKLEDEGEIPMDMAYRKLSEKRTELSKKLKRKYRAAAKFGKM